MSYFCSLNRRYSEKTRQVYTQILSRTFGTYVLHSGIRIAPAVRLAKNRADCRQGIGMDGYRKNACIRMCYPCTDGFAAFHSFGIHNDDGKLR